VGTAILKALRRVAADERLFDIPEAFDLLPVLPEHCKILTKLPQLHRDPFDRMLIAQTRVEDLPLLSRDKMIIGYAADGARMVPS
jgi:PIN domain nuclease of toxin-antitoxin system